MAQLVETFCKKGSDCRNELPVPTDDFIEDIFSASPSQDNLLYANTIAEQASVTRVVQMPTLGVKGGVGEGENVRPFAVWTTPYGAQADMGVIADLKPSQFSVVTSSSCADACAALTMAVQDQRLGSVLTVGLEGQTSASAKTSVLENVGVCASVTDGRFNVPYAFASTAKTHGTSGLSASANAVILEAYTGTPGSIHETALRLSENLLYTRSIESDETYSVVTPTPAVRSDNENFSPPRAESITWTNALMETVTVENAEGLYTPFACEMAEGQTTFNVNVWSCETGSGLRLMGPRATCDYEPAPVCGDILPTRMEAVSSYLTTNTELLVTACAACFLSLTFMFLLIRVVMKAVQ
ncbi:hypothetical protein KIPB_009738, partial [Kipferlia bialata]|eukprot:g9738.t1